MTAEMSCEQVREVAAEVALDIADGEERDAVLRHLSHCSECRRFVFELSSIGDELLSMLAPVREPSVGFESRVLSALGSKSGQTIRPLRDRRKRWVLATAVAAAVVVVAALGGLSVFIGTSDDRQLAQSYRATLEEGNGSFFAAAPLRGPSGREGTVFGYEGSPSWVVVTQQSLGDEHRVRVQVVTRDGRYLGLGDAVLGGSNQAWGRQLPVDLSTVLEIRFLGSQGERLFTATFDGENPWE
jgi:hypothetical protein